MEINHENILILVIFCALLLYGLYLMLIRPIWQRHVTLPRRLEYIKRYGFSASMRLKLSEEHPELSSHDISRVFDGLQQFFLIAHHAEDKVIGMPSKIVDAAWHQFILHSTDYHVFCKQAFGRMLNHVPSSSLEDTKNAAEELKRTWRIACLLENINPKHPVRIPLIFSLDSELKIINGNYYESVNNELRATREGEKNTSQTSNLSPLFLCGGCVVGCGGSGCAGS